MKTSRFVLLLLILSAGFSNCKKETTPPEDILFNAGFSRDTTILLLENSTFQVNITPADAKVKMALSVDPNYIKPPQNGVITISETGEIKAMGEGKVYVTISNNTGQLTFNVVVVKMPSVLPVLNTTLVVKTGKTGYLDAWALLNPYEQACLGGLKYEGYDKSLISVSDDGHVTALKEGDTKVKVSLGKFPAVNSEYSISVLNHFVYLAGNCIFDNGQYVPAYWKNNLDMMSNNGHYYQAMDYFNDKLYLVGYLRDYEKNFAFISDINSKKQFSETSGSARGIAHAGADIFVCGSYVSNNIRTVALWKNSALDPVLTAPEITTASAGTCIAASGNDLYIGGYIKNSQGKQVACYWKNKQRTDLMDGTQNSVVNSISADDQNLYAAGYYVNELSENIACCWVNGLKYDLHPGPSQASSICVANNNVYVAGSYENGNENVACYWKNSIKHDLPIRSDAMGGYAVAVKVVDNYEYIGGYFELPDLFSGGVHKSIGCYWRNGIRHDIPPTVTVYNGTYPYSSVSCMAID